MSDGPLPAPGTTLLQARGLVKDFGPVRALRGVDLSVRAGEVLGLLGDNGAGKSTLVKILAGRLRHTEGELVVAGKTRAFGSVVEAREAGIETVYQDLGLIPTLNIAENVFLNRERFVGGIGRRLSIMDRRRMDREVSEGLADLGLSLPDLKTKVEALSGGQRQAVAIARAVLWGGHIVVLDEPAAALGVRQTEIVLGFIERLRERGLSVMLVSHNMEQVERLCDRIACLRLGTCVFEGDASEVSRMDLVGLMTGARES